MIDRFKRLEAAETAIRGLYLEADREHATLGVSPHPVLYRSIARALVDMERFEEARLWFRLALKDDPADLDSKRRLERLESPAKRN